MAREIWRNKSNIEGFQCGICKHYETKECNYCQRNCEDLFERK